MSYCVGQFNLLNGTAFKHITVDGCKFGVYSYTFKLVAAAEQIVAQLGCICRDGNSSKAITAAKGALADGSKAVRQGDVGKNGARRKSLNADRG